MLVVTRKLGEGIKIGDDVEITIVKIDDNSVKVSINAPKEVKILRSELYKEVGEENINASKINMELLPKIKK
ncbi:carbon storage regulator [Clostridium sulfidigenes]|uniref:Translational regulator CsrA n=1 Tax=Clostridium sulfidigenes TaxID=318464 RepID=A0A084JIL3_9CLOT|nr:carbon storage regulator CsrA [Clostridium sulfidigenes]KEZ88797.1 carbon storage regulator [Clostridium sulfidigenes]